MVSTDGKLELANTTLETNEVLLEQGLLLLDGTDLVLQFHVFNLLKTKVLLQVIFNSRGFNLEGLSDFGRLVREHVFELLFFLT